MTTESEIQRIIGDALWQEGIDDTHAIEEIGKTGIVIRTDDGSEFKITIVKWCDQ